MRSPSGFADGVIAAALFWMVLMADGDLSDALGRLRVEWNKTEEYLKIAEQINGKAIIPGVNELRYAGRKILEALEIFDSDKAKALSILNDALHDCYRARHDSIDASVGMIAAHVQLSVDNLGYTRVLGALPNLGTFLDNILKVNEKIANSRGRRLNRDSIYEDIKEIDLAAIRRDYGQLKSSEPFLEQEVKRERRRTLMTYLIGAVGLILTIVGILVTAFAA